MRKKSILIVHDYPAIHGGGVTNLNLDLARFLAAGGYAVTILSGKCCSRCDNAEGLSGTPFIRLIQVGGKISSLRIKKLVLAHDYLLVNTSEKVRDIARTATGSAAEFQKKYVTWVHSVFPLDAQYQKTESGYAFARILSDPNCSFVVCVSQAVRKSIENIFGFQNKIRVVYPGVYVPGRFEVSHLKRGTKMSGDILFAARLSREKGGDIFIRALALLRSSFPNLRAVVVGDGPEANTLRKLSQDLGLTGMVQFIHALEREKFVQVLPGFRVLCLPSLTESFGIVIAEALSAGVSVVASNIEGPAEILQKGEFGFLFRKGNHRDLALKLKQALGQGNRAIDPQLYAIGTFDAHRQFRKIEQVLLKEEFPPPYPRSLSLDTARCFVRF